MAKSLQEYMDWLEKRSDLIWPKAPRLKPVQAQPHLKPLRGIRAVVWNLYGTLVRITDGELLLFHHDRMRMQVALEKTISEFNMWNSMTRKAIAPWEYLLPKYQATLEAFEVAPTSRAGDFAHVNGSRVWRSVIEMLREKDYTYDRGFYGDEDDYAQKVAYFYQACLQGVEAAPNAAQALIDVSEAGLVQGLLADAQSFSLMQALRVLGDQTRLPPASSLFDSKCLFLSCRLGVRKPSPTLFEACISHFAERNIQPSEILYVGNRLQGDLAVARQAGLRTALYAGDGNSLKASGTELRHPDLKPKRMLTDLKQIRSLLGG